jgi:hypothetical protein
VWLTVFLPSEVRNLKPELSMLFSLSVVEVVTLAC